MEGVLWYCVSIGRVSLMRDVLERLYRQFYLIPQHTVHAQRIEENYQMLVQHLDKEDLKRMRHILDEKDLLLSEVSLDSFIRGFQLGSALFHQMRDYEGLSDESLERSEK